MAKLSDEQKTRAHGAIVEVLSNGPAEFGHLWPAADKALGLVPNATSGPGYRFADGWLQRQKRAGNITFERIGRQCFWSLTPAGRAALQEA